MSREPSPACRLEVRVDGIDAASQELAEHICAEVWEAGALGIEESVESSEIMLSIYTRDSHLAAVQNAALETLGDAGQLGPSTPIEEQDWSESWKQDIEAVEVSTRLVVRPSFVDFELSRRQQELIIDPRQAFGTGGHASTFLALEWVDALSDCYHARTRVLDIGTGTGILALAALQLGAGQAVGCDIDAIAIHEATHWAEVNGLADRFTGLAGGIEVVHERGFDLIVANLLRREILPLVADVAERLGLGGQIVLSGLLVQDQAEVAEAFVAHGLLLEDLRSERDGNGDEWVSLLLARA